MKKYKHIPTGDIWIECEAPAYKGYIKHQFNTLFKLPIHYVTTNNKDWEEVKDKPEWTILSFKGKLTSRIFKFNATNNWYFTSNGLDFGSFSLKDCLERGFIIHSVRRESDGEVFTLGDLCTSSIADHFGNFKVEKFTPTSSGDSMVVNGHGYQTSLRCLQKIKPKEWEITAFRNKESQRIDKRVGNLFNYNPDWKDGVSEDIMLAAINTYEIYAVKRLSDGVEFKIKDIVTEYRDDTKTRFKLYRIDFLDNKLTFFGTTKDGDSVFDISEIEHAKQPLFTTEDGVDVYDGDKFYYINPDVWKIKDEKASLKRTTCFLNHYSWFKFFSTKEAAEEYIIINNPILSIKELKEAAIKHSCNNFKLFEVAKELVKSKLK